MQLIELSEKNKQAYNDFVAANESGSFLQSWEWGEWQSALGRQVKRFKLSASAKASADRQDESEEIIGAIQLVRMPLPFGRYYLYAPYGPVAAFGANYKLQITNYKTNLKSKMQTFKVRAIWRA